MITNIVSFLVIGVFVFWYGVSICNQVPRWRKLIRRIINFDICSLVPIWTFFAPNPGRSDLYLLYRDRDPEGHVSSWRQVMPMRRRSWWKMWAPRRRIGKGIVDVSANFTKDVNYLPHNPVSKKFVLGFPYLLLLNYVSCKPVSFHAEMRQFALARVNGYGTEEDPEVVFLSAFHLIKPITP
jgi:hypothetical protein